MEPRKDLSPEPTDTVATPSPSKDIADFVEEMYGNQASREELIKEGKNKNPNNYWLGVKEIVAAHLTAAGHSYEAIKKNPRARRFFLHSEYLNRLILTSVDKSIVDIAQDQVFLCEQMTRNKKSEVEIKAAVKEKLDALELSSEDITHNLSAVKHFRNNAILNPLLPPVDLQSLEHIARKILKEEKMIFAHARKKAREKFSDKPHQEADIVRESSSMTRIIIDNMLYKQNFSLNDVANNRVSRIIFESSPQLKHILDTYSRFNAIKSIVRASHVAKRDAASGIGLFAQFNILPALSDADIISQLDAMQPTVSQDPSMSKRLGTLASLVRSGQKNEYLRMYLQFSQAAPTLTETKEELKPPSPNNPKC